MAQANPFAEVFNIPSSPETQVSGGTGGEYTPAPTSMVSGQPIASPSGNGMARMWAKLEPTGGKSGLDGTTLYWATKADGQRQIISQNDIERQIRLGIEAGDYTAAEAQKKLDSYGFNTQMGDDGRVAILNHRNSSSSGSTGSTAPTTGGTAGGSAGSVGANGHVVGGQGGAGQRYTGTGVGGAGGDGSGGGGSAGYNAGAATQGGGGGMQRTTELGGASGGGTGQNVDFNAPLGWRNPGPGPGAINPGGQPNPFSRPQSIFQGMPANPNMWDVITSVTRRQEENRDSALQNLGNVYNETMGGNSAQLRGNVSNLLANPYSLDEATIQNITGRNTDAATQRASQLETAGAARAASMGTGRSFDPTSIRNQANQAVTEGERNTRVQAAVQNQQDARTAISTGSQATQGDIGTRERLAGSAARDVLGTSSFYGDAWLQNMLNGQGNNQSGQYGGFVPTPGYGGAGGPWTYRQ